jgi:hypothetical protein
MAYALQSLHLRNYFKSSKPWVQNQQPDQETAAAPTSISYVDAAEQSNLNRDEGEAPALLRLQSSAFPQRQRL